MVNPMVAGGATGVGSMVKALMDGNSQYGDEQAKQQNLQKMIAARQTPPVMPPQAGVAMGQPQMMSPPAMAPSPPAMGGQNMPMPRPVNPASMTGGVPLPGMPNGIDPSMQALFSQIPGAGGQ